MEKRRKGRRMREGKKEGCEVWWRKEKEGGREEREREGRNRRKAE